MLRCGSKLVPPCLANLIAAYPLRGGAVDAWLRTVWPTHAVALPELSNACTLSELLSGRIRHGFAVRVMPPSKYELAGRSQILTSFSL